MDSDAVSSMEFHIAMQYGTQNEQQEPRA